MPSATHLLVTAVLALLAILAGPLADIAHLGLRELVILLLIVLSAVLVLAPSERVLRAGFVAWILTFGLGWRTVHLGGILSVHPSEALAWLLFILLLARRVAARMPLGSALPRPAQVLLVFVVLGLATARFFGRAPDLIIQEAKVFLAIIPGFYVVQWHVANRTDWERAGRLAILVATYVSGLGLLEYFAPALTQALVGDAPLEEVYTVEGLRRVGFVIYGSFAAGFLIFTFFGLACRYFLSSLRGPWPTTVLGALVVLVQVIGIYFSGYRGLWYAAGIFLLAYVSRQRRALVLLGAAVASVPLMAPEFLERLLSIFNLQPYDSSPFRRIERAIGALDLIQQTPLTGVGWGGSGYVHSDMLQIAANLGVPALAIFVLWIISVIWFLYRMARQGGWAASYASALFATTCGLLAVFAVEGLIVWPQLMVPIWFVIGLAYRLKDVGHNPQASPEVRHDSS